MSRDYTVTVEVSITANTPEQAAAYALMDLRDRDLGPWNFDVRECATGTMSKVEAGSTKVLTCLEGQWKLTDRKQEG
jgi:hypothetical protein